MNNKLAAVWTLFLVALLALSACENGQMVQQLESINQSMKKSFAPDSREKVYEISVQKQRKSFIIKGVTTEADAIKALKGAAEAMGVSLVDSITLLPKSSLQATPYAMTCLSMATLRYQPDFSSEAATQTIMGTPVQLLDSLQGWFRVKTPEGYIAWASEKSLTPVSQERLQQWQRAEKVIVTKHYTLFRQEPLPGAQVVSDATWGCVAELLDTVPFYYHIQLPDGRTAYVSRLDAEPYPSWLESRVFMPEAVIATAFQMVGIPYLWGGTTVKAMDCSGFTKTVYLLNGMILARDASQQARTGTPVDISTGWQQLQMGDLIFFGRRATQEKTEAITHVGLYVGDGRFLHASGCVRLNSLDPVSAIYYEGAPNLLKAVRLLDNVDMNKGVVSIKAHPWYSAK